MKRGRGAPATPGPVAPEQASHPLPKRSSGLSVQEVSPGDSAEHKGMAETF